jgi:hypothetical protein
MTDTSKNPFMPLDKGMKDEKYVNKYENDLDKSSAKRKISMYFVA